MEDPKFKFQVLDIPDLLLLSDERKEQLNILCDQVRKLRKDCFSNMTFDAPNIGSFPTSGVDPKQIIELIDKDGNVTEGFEITPDDVQRKANLYSHARISKSAIMRGMSEAVFADMAKLEGTLQLDPKTAEELMQNRKVDCIMRDEDARFLVELNKISPYQTSNTSRGTLRSSNKLSHKTIVGKRKANKSARRKNRK